LVEGIERLTGFQQNGVSAGGVLPAPYRDVDVQRIQFDTTTETAGFVGRHKG